MERLLGVERQRTAVSHIAERAAPGADVAHDHECRGTFAEALADIRARGFLAHRVQTMLAQNLLDFVEPRRRRGAHANPVGFLQPLGRDDLDRILGKYARRLRCALVLDAGGVGMGPRACGLIHQFGRGAAPRGGAIRALGRPCGAHMCAPTLASSLRDSAAALPPEGELFAPWGGPAALMSRSRSATR